MTGVAIAVRCNWCSHQLAPHRIHQLQSGQFICEKCIEWHNHAMEFLSGAVPKGCQVCNSTWEQLRAADPQAVSMFIVPKDGINQILCRPCKEKYVVKRLDLYGNTEFSRTL